MVPVERSYRGILALLNTSAPPELTLALGYHSICAILSIRLLCLHVIDPFNGRQPMVPMSGMIPGLRLLQLFIRKATSKDAQRAGNHIQPTIHRGTTGRAEPRFKEPSGIALGLVVRGVALDLDDLRLGKEEGIAECGTRGALAACAGAHVDASWRALHGDRELAAQTLGRPFRSGHFG